MCAAPCGSPALQVAPPRHAPQGRGVMIMIVSRQVCPPANALYYLVTAAVRPVHCGEPRPDPPPSRASKCPAEERLPGGRRQGAGRPALAQGGEPRVVTLTRVSAGSGDHRSPHRGDTQQSRCSHCGASPPCRGKSTAAPRGGWLVPSRACERASSETTANAEVREWRDPGAVELRTNCRSARSLPTLGATAPVSRPNGGPALLRSGAGPHFSLR